MADTDWLSSLSANYRGVCAPEYLPLAGDLLGWSCAVVNSFGG
jgi:hypothetical protein